MKKFFALLKVSVKSMLLTSTSAQGSSRKKAAEWRKKTCRYLTEGSGLTRRISRR